MKRGLCIPLENRLLSWIGVYQKLKVEVVEFTIETDLTSRDDALMK